MLRSVQLNSFISYKNVVSIYNASTCVSPVDTISVIDPLLQAGEFKTNETSFETSRGATDVCMWPTN